MENNINYEGSKSMINHLNNQVILYADEEFRKYIVLNNIEYGIICTSYWWYKIRLFCLY